MSHTKGSVTKTQKFINCHFHQSAPISHSGTLVIMEGERRQLETKIKRNTD